MKKSLVFTLILSTCAIGTAVASEMFSTAPDYTGNERKGQYLYKKYCRDFCHDNNTAVERSPMDLTMAQWEALGSNLQSIDCSKDWSDELTATDLNDIFSYLHNGAADSANPTK